MLLKELTLFTFVVVAVGGVSLVDGDTEADDREPMKVEWDLRDGHRLCSVNWPDDVTDEDAQISVSGPIDLTIQLPEKRVFQGHAGMIAIRRDRKSDQIRLILVQAGPSPLSAAYETACQWCEQFNVDVAKLDKWYEKASQSPDTVRDFEHSNNSPGLSYTIGVVATFERPRHWHSTFQITWAQASNP